MEHKELVLPSSVRKRLRVEAGSTMREYVGDEVGLIDTFKKFGFTEENVTRIAKSLLSQLELSESK
ncbi:hypothetical protein QQP08_004620, partial [Theobroma cacao]